MTPPRTVADIERLTAITNEAIDALSYEDAMVLLEEVVHALEAEGTPIAVGLRLYEIGNLLSRKCGDTLDKTEARMVQLLGDAQNPSEATFDPEKDGR